MPSLPTAIDTEEALDEILTRPRPELVELVRGLEGPLLVLGAGGKMGPTLAVLARRAAEAAGRDLEVIAVSRFSDARASAWLEERGVRTVSADLLEREAVLRLPEAPDVIHLVGLKFGTSIDPAATWATNTLAPAAVAERYPRARIVALSTGNVYSLVPAGSGGSVESDEIVPRGDYAAACVARERIFEHFSRKQGTPVILIRLNYAVELRYGVLVDIARKVQTGEPVDLSMGWLNLIWQGDANDMVLRSLAFASAPPAVLNLTGREAVSVRALAERLGEHLGREPNLAGREAGEALLSSSARACALLGEPPTPLEPILRWTAHWLRSGGRLLGRPTHFEVRDGRY